jgi:hypothetical protein
MDYATNHGNSYADRERNSPKFFFYIISQILNVSSFGNTADVYAIVHLVPHACQHITVDHICYYCLIAANQGNCERGLFLKKFFESFSLYQLKNYHDPFRILIVANF